MTEKACSAAMKNPGKIFIIASLLCMAALPLSAAQIETEFDQSRIAVQDSAILKLKITGVQNATPGKIPHIKNLSIVYRGSSSSFEYVNGKTWSGVTLEYAVRPLAEGSFTIPPITVNADGQTLQSDAVNITASKNAPRRQQSRFPGFPGFPGFPDEDAVSPPDRDAEIKGSIDISKSSLYAGDVLIVRYYVSGAQGIGLNGFETLPEMTGFIRKDLDEKTDPPADASRQKIVSFLLVPQSKGTYTIGGGRAVFGNGLAQVDFPVQKINVRNLPSEGRPDSYSGNIGSFSMTADGTALSCAAFEEKKITVKVSGSGNFMSIHPPVVTVTHPDIKVIVEEEEAVIHAEGSAVKGEKTFTLTVLPEKEGIFNLGDISFNYFDPSAAAYKTLTAGPVKCAVSGIAEKKDDGAAVKTGHISWIIILAAVAGAALFLFGGIMLYERRKYGSAFAVSADAAVKKAVSEKPAGATHQELSRIKYEMTVSIEHNNIAQFMKTAEIILNRCSSTDGEVVALKDMLYGYKYGGKSPDKEALAALCDRIMAAAGY